MPAPRLAVIGAGPMGLEAALRAQARGWSVTVWEAGTVGAHLLRWGSVRFFTPTAMNISAVAHEKLREKITDFSSFSPETPLTGTEHVEQVLRPLAAALGCVREGHRVRAVSRRRTQRGELWGNPLRHQRPFELLIEGPDGEFTEECDGVLDATGVYATPRGAGRSGAPVPGERNTTILRHLPDLSQDPEGWRAARVLVIGNGASAATVINGLAALRADGGGLVSWVVPDDRSRPIDEVPDDPLPVRRSLLKQANDLAARPPAWLKVLRRGAITAFSSATTGEIIATVLLRGGATTVTADRALSMTGYRPDARLLDAVAVHLDPAFEGSGPLAAAINKVTDCLAKIEVTASDLASGEPDLFLIGHRAYGARNTFLLQTGFDQLDVLFQTWNLSYRG